MILLDSYAVLAFLKDEPAAAEVAALLDDDEEDVRLTALGLAEVVDHLVRLAGAHPEKAALDLAELGFVEALPVDGLTALRAGILRARHYHRTHRAVSLADCVAAELARAESALATADPHLLDLCDEEGIDVVVLPDSTGGVWAPVSPA